MGRLAKRPRRVLPLATLLVLAAMAAVALAQVGGTPGARAAAVTSVTGSFEITDSREGEPIFDLAGIAPGESTGGTVTIADAGSEPVALRLHRGDLVDIPGTGGGVLSERLQLSVVDITRPATPVSVYSGPLATMPDRPLGDLTAGEARTYRFTATLPEGGTPEFQNAVQGATTTVAYDWIAEEASGEGEEEPGGEGEGGGGESGKGGSGGGSGRDQSGARDQVQGTATSPGQEQGTPANPGRARATGTPPTSPPFAIRVARVKWTAGGRRLSVWVTCNRTCRLIVGARIRTRVEETVRGARVRYRGRRLLPAGTHRFRLRLPSRLLPAGTAEASIQARLSLIATGPSGERATARRTVRLPASGPTR